MRRWNWVELLQDAIVKAEATPFDYGGANCGLFAAECIDAICEDSHRADELRTQFKDEASARLFVTLAGGIEAAVTERLGKPVSWALARRGDVCLMPTQDGPGLGICRGLQVAMMSPTGITHIKIDKALAVWRID